MRDLLVRVVVALTAAISPTEFRVEPSESAPKVNYHWQLTPRQVQACKHKNPTFRYRGKSR